MNGKGRGAALWVLLTAAMLVVAACGSSDSSSGTDAEASSGRPVVLGAICSCSGAQSAALGRLKDVFDTWAKSVNTRGGVNGSPVRLIIEDDGGDPTRSLRAVRKLVEQDKVVAIIGDSSLVGTTWADYVTEKDIPVVGGLSVESPFLTHADFFVTGAPLPVTTVGIWEAAKAAGKKKVGLLYCSESAVCAQLEGLGRAASALVGGVGIATGKISAAAPDYTAACLALRDEGVDALFVAHSSEVVPRVVDSCAQQGFTPAVIGQTPALGPSWLGHRGFDGALLVSPTVLYTDGSVPAVKEFLDALDTYYPDLRKSRQFTYDTIYPWAGGKLFEAAARAGNIGPDSTPADVKKGLYALKGETLGGIIPPTTFTEGQPVFPTCYFQAAIRGGRAVSLGKGATKCLTEAQALRLAQALRS
ncbi:MULTISPECIES: ABC transporter substrate-binding protein [unclassified Frankia]|uniref:ABC transporter substrate-binding protein n=1 Tax=unclassified Frankia TaxID=2632575 RepID=UPI0020240C9B